MNAITDERLAAVSQASVQPICEVRTWDRRAIPVHIDRLNAFIFQHERVAPSRDLRWLNVLACGLKHEPYLLEAIAGGRTVGVLPLCFVRSLLFGRFLVSLPYLNSAGVVSNDPAATAALIDHAVQLAERLNVRHLELRHETEAVHPSLGHTRTDKVHMRRCLPDKVETLWKDLGAKVRNQVQKGERNKLSVMWGREELLSDFYDVFAHNMRDLGTPVYGRSLFANILAEFPDRAEICVVRRVATPVAAALVVHGRGITEAPSASSLRQHNHTNANMLMYWHLLKRSVERGQSVFDFGRSSHESSTFRFKSQWKGAPQPAIWQYHVRSGAADVRPDNPKYHRKIRIWQSLPVALTRLFGPWIVRGIP